MSVTVRYQLNGFEIDALQDEGFTTLKLYYSDNPEGPFSDSTVSPDQDLSTAESGDEPYIFKFDFGNGNPAQWFKVVAYDGAGGESDLSESETFHGGGGTTLKRLRRLLGKLVYGYLAGTTTSDGAADGSTAIAETATFKRYPDNYFGTTDDFGWIFFIPSDDDWTNVAGWTRSSGEFSFDPNFDAQIESGTEFEVLNRWTPEEFKEAINWSINNVYPKLSQTTVYESIIAPEDIYSYVVPNSIRIINKVEIDDQRSHEESEDTRTYGRPWREVAYQPYYDGMEKRIEFKNALEEGTRIRITGTTILSRLNTDQDYVEVKEPQSELIVYKAAHRLYALLSNDAATSDVSRYRDQSNYFQALYNEMAANISTPRRSKKIWSQQNQWATPYGKRPPERYWID